MIGCKQEQLTVLGPNTQHPLPQPKNRITTLLKIWPCKNFQCKHAPGWVRIDQPILKTCQESILLRLQAPRITCFQCHISPCCTCLLRKQIARLHIIIEYSLSLRRLKKHPSSMNFSNFTSYSGCKGQLLQYCRRISHC